jgi:PAS domain S-box-containing protein
LSIKGKDHAMKRNSRKGKAEEPDSVRRRAERLLPQKAKDKEETGGGDTAELVHELQVHQIELEMQNEALRKAQAEVEKSRSRYFDLYDFAPVGYVTFDQKGMILEANLAGAKLLGVERSLLVRLPFIRFLSPESRSTFHLHLKSVFSTGTKETCELKFIRENGDPFYVSVESISSKDNEGTPVQCRSAVIDITERKRAEEELQKAHGELEIRVRKRTEELVNVNQALEAEITERKQAEEALRKAHDELEKQVMERTSDLSGIVERLRVENIHRKQLEDTLRESEIQVRFFASQCLTAQETERKRVAGELHDSIAASLGAIKFKIEKVVEEMKQGHGSPESLQDLGSNVTEINNEVRRIMADLRPSVLDDLGIIVAINWFSREYQKTYSHISVEKQISISEEIIPDSLKTPIFRISQEAMNNIAKHSQASLVNLALRKEDNKILLTIKDNGQGFAPDTTRKGIGLSTMRERAQLSGGSFDLESAVGKGTIIRASWPI